MCDESFERQVLGSGQDTEFWRQQNARAEQRRERESESERKSESERGEGAW